MKLTWFLESKRFREKRENFKIKSVNKLLKGFDDHKSSDCTLLL